MTAWTPAAIRAATPHPKPTNALSRIEASFYVAGDGDWLLRHIAEFGSIINDGRALRGDCRLGHNGEWLLVPVTAGMVDALASIGAELADLEPAEDDEHGGDDEPSLGSRNTFTQVGWGTQHSDIVDAEDQHDGAEPDHDAETQSWESWTPPSPPTRRSARRRA